MFHLTTLSTHFTYGNLATHSTHFTYGYVESKEGNVLFNDALNAFYLRLYGVGHM